MINLSSVVSSDLPLSGSDISENSIPKEPFSTSLECDPETYEKLVGEVEQRRMTFPNFKELDEHIRSVGAIIPTPNPLPVFTMEEVRLHNRPDDCWVVANGYVYDVTIFLRYHPAGVRSILRHAGSDSTVDFNFHSRSARRMWNYYRIGRLNTASSLPCTLL